MRFLAVLLALSCVVMAIAAAHASAAVRPFGTPRFQTNDNGAITYVGNTLSTCQDGSASNGATCDDGRAGLNNLYNNQVPNQRVNVAGFGAGTTADSSRATFTLPPAAQVVWAGLYWGAEAGGANPAQTIQLAGPTGGAPTTFTAQQFDTGAPQGHETGGYQGFANVTDFVKAQGGGVYTAGGIPILAPSTVGGNPVDSYGGWTIVIVTKDPNQPSRNLSVFDGFETVNTNNQPTINVTGFLTPPTGAVNTQLGIIAYEGDKGITGDFAQLNGQNLSDSANPATNFFNSTLTTLGNRRTGSTPDYDNQFGYDADIVDATGRIPNGATSASIKLGSNGDVYAPGVVTLATELYAPKFTPRKTVENRSRATGPTQRGDLLRYTVSYENTGGDAAAGMRIDDAIPAGTTYVPGSLAITGPAGSTSTPTDAAGDDAGEFDTASNSVRFRPGAGGSATSGGRIEVGQTATVTFDVRANQNLADNARVDNTATASYRASTSGVGFTDLASPTATTFVRAPDLQIAKTVTSGPITAGPNVQFALSVTTAGGAPSNGTVTVTDTVPADAFPTIRGASGNGWTCTVNGRVVTCTRSDALAAGAGYPPIILDVTAANNLPATVQNTTTVSGGGDSNTTNNTGTATGPGTNRADLNVAKRFGQSSAIVGDTVSWTIEVRNDGPSDATGATVTDTVPAGLNVTAVTTSRGTCSAVGTSPINCALGTIPSGQNAVVTVTATVAGAPRTVNNTASATSNVTDPNTANNSSTASLVVNPSADLSITKTGPATPPAAGDTYSFTLTARNAGPDTAQNVNVIDAIPANFNVTNVTATGNFTCNQTAARVSCTAPTLASGATQTITVTGTSTAGGLVTNSATIDSPTADPVTCNNSATVSTPVGTRADLSLTKSFNPAGPVATGDTTTVSLAVTNGGPRTATNVVARDTLPAALTFVSSANGCTAAGQVVTCPIGNLANGALGTASFVVRVAANATGTVSNTANVTSDVADPFPGNNSSTANLPLTALADLSVTNVADVATANVGQTVNWTVTTTNQGPSIAANPRVTIQLPQGVTNIQVTSTTNGATCGAIDPATRTITCTAPSLNSGDNFVVRFSGVPGNDLAGKTLLDPATVTSDTGDPNLGNNTAQASVAVNPAYSLTVDKIARDTTVAPNQATTFDIDVRNAGPSDATNVTLTDTLPASTVFVSADPGCAVDGGVVTCAIDRIAAGTTARRTITIRTTSANANSTITNSARYSTNDPEGIDKNKNQPANSDSATVAVSPIADLQVTNTPNRTTASVGDDVSWTVVGRNLGPNPAVNATFTVQLPDNVDNLTITANNANCTRAGQVLTCSPGTLANGDSASVTFGGTVARAAAGTTLGDPATITSDTADPVPGNNTANGAIAIARRYELSVDKTARDTAVNPGDQTTFDLRVTNAGPNTATGVNLIDRLPNGTTFVSGSAGCTSNGLGTVTCAVGSVAPNTTETRQITIQTSAGNAGQTIVNQMAYTTPDGADVDVNKNNAGLASDTASVNVNSVADLRVTNTATVINPRADGSVEPGGTVRWNIVGTNGGPSAATNAALTVRVPDSVSNITLDPANSQGCTVQGQLITCLRGTLPNGATIPLTFTGTIATSAAGTAVVVPANITSDTSDLALANNDASSTVQVGRRYALTLTKTAVDATVDPGANASFDLNIKNDGPSDATNVTLTDTLPNGTTFVSAGTNCAPGAGNTVVCQVDVPAGQTVTRRITVQTPNTPGTTITNTARYTTNDSNVIDVNKDDTTKNTGTASVAIAPRADLAVTINRTPGSPDPVVGGPISFTVVGTNNGPNTAVSPVLTVRVPDGITITSVGAGCSFSGQTVTCNPDTLAPNGTIQTVITGTVTRPLAGQTITVPATINSATTADPNTANNSASTTATVGRRYEMKVEKTASQTRVGPGQDITYTLKITNNGPNDATGVTLVDPLPANTTLVSATQGCTVTGTTVSCPVGDLANGASATREITVRPTGAAAGTTVTNSARYTTPDGPAVDVNRGTADGTGTASVQVTPLVDLAITKSVTPGRVTAGGEVIYTLDVVNNGPNGATGVVVGDDLPAGLTVLQTTPTQGACGVNGRTVRCDLGAVAAGGRAQVIIRARADSAGTAVNQATVTSDQAESDPANNTSGQVPLVIDPAPANPPVQTPPAAAPADLVLNKELISKTVTVGRVLTYRITVTNRGGSVARGVRVTDVPSRTLDVLGVKPTVGTCPGRSPITCNLGDLAPGQSAQVTVSVRANAPGKLSNAATAVATGSPDVPAETDVADTSVRRLASSVSVKKTASSKTVRGGSTVKFTIRVKNFTKKTVRKVLVCDTLPRGLVFQKASPLKVTGRKACGTIATLKAGQVRTFVVTVRAESRKTAKTLKNAARAVVPNELSSKASRAIRVTPGPGATGNGGVTG
jgi:uncharacterized repeat protein (TIGR01451 family)